MFSPLKSSLMGSSDPFSLMGFQHNLWEAEKAAHAQFQSRKAREQANKRPSPSINLYLRLAATEDVEALIYMILEVHFEVVSRSSIQIGAYEIPA